MPDLRHHLRGQDLGFLRIVAKLWGIDFNASDVEQGQEILARTLLDVDLVEQERLRLPEDARAALLDLQGSSGRIPWAQFVRRYGPLREMGSGRRDRERPYLEASSTTETLWYRSLIARDFFETPGGVEEFSYIPDDLLHLLAPQNAFVKGLLGRPAQRKEYAQILLASDLILDHACTLLAGLRMGLARDVLTRHWHEETRLRNPISPDLMQVLLSSAGLLDENRQPIAEPVRLFLEKERSEALLQLVQAWMLSPDFNDLRLVPGLLAEGEWINDPLLTREAVLKLLTAIPSNTWWSQQAFLDAVQQVQPDFQRPAGDYDSWFIRKESTGEYLRGFEHWQDVDGALMRFMITGPMHWIGIMDLAAPEDNENKVDLWFSAFRLSKWSSALLSGHPSGGSKEVTGSIMVRSDGRIYVPRLAPRAIRYQVARFTEWDEQKDDGYPYRITTGSLERAAGQGLKVSHILAILKHQSAAVPPSLERALKRWQERGVEARLDRVTILRVSHPEIMKSLKRTPASRYMGDPLGTTSVVIKPGGAEKVRSTLLEMGFLGDISIDPN